MLKLEPQKILEEIRAQTRERDRHLRGIAELVDRYPGEWWSMGGTGAAGFVNSENAAFEYMAYTMAQLVWAPPRWRATSSRGRSAQFAAEAVESFMNAWSSDSTLKATLEDLATDYCFGWGVALVTPVPLVESYEAEDPAYMPQLSRISPWDFGMDHRAATPRRTRMQWHRYRIDREDAIEAAERDRELPRDRREGWDLKAIEGLSTVGSNASTVAVMLGSSKTTKPHQVGSYNEPDREQIEVYQVYLPGHQLEGKPGPEEGFNGTLLTLGTSQSEDTAPVLLRPPMPFFGPRWGPYTVIGAYVVPDNVWPLSVLAATGGHIEQASRLAKAVDEQVRAYKRMGITSDHVLAKLIQDGKNEHIYTARSLNLEQLFREFEVGGTTAANVAAEQRQIAKRDRAMGLAAQQRGVTTGDTATDVATANDAASARQGYVRARWHAGVQRIGITAAYYAWHSSDLVVPLPGVPEAYGKALEAYGIDPEMLEASFVGGVTGQEGMTFDELGLELEPRSMERQSDVALRNQGELLAQVVQMVPAFPAIAQVGGDVKGLLDAFGEAYGYPKLSRLFPGLQSVDLASIQPAEAEPRLTADAGPAALLKGLRSSVGAGAGGSRPPAPAEFGSPQVGSVTA